MSGYKVQEFEEGMESQIIELLDIVFQPWPKNQVKKHDFWVWKYQTYSQKHHIVVTKDKNKIVGCHHSHLFKLIMGDEEVTLTYSTDMAVHPDYRNQGIFRVQVSKLKEIRQ